MTTLKYVKKGMIVMCDFKGLVVPEMVKKRPVVVLNFSSNLVTILPCSTTEPEKIEDFHYKLPDKSMPRISMYNGKQVWVKCNMINTVGLSRISLIKMYNGYYKDLLGPEQMVNIVKCLKIGIGLKD